MTPGSRLKSTMSAAEVVVVRPAREAVTLSCGGAPMLGPGDAAPAQGGPAPEAAPGLLVGKRYVDAASGLEVLCSKAGAGALSADGRPLALKEAKPLPGSD